MPLGRERPLAVIDVTDWPEDSEFAVYPEGARDKAALFPPTPLPFEFLRSDRRYLFKLSDKRFPDQFWAEIIAYRISLLLGVDVPPAFAAVHRGRGECGALIEWFFTDGERSFVSGGNRLQHLHPDYDRRRGTHHNFKLVRRACINAARTSGLSTDWADYWGKAIVFDALIGNTDRHQDNWGFLSWIAENGQATEQLTPLFDNGTSLGMERHVEHVSSWDDERCRTYLRKGCHHMKWAQGDETRCGHMELVERFLKEEPYKALKPVLQTLITQFSLDRFTEVLMDMRKLELPHPLSAERIDFTLRLVRMRYGDLCTILS